MKRISAFFSIAALLLTLAVATPAAACGMYEPPHVDSATDRFAKANDAYGAGDLAEAVRYARGVAHDRTVDRTLRAQAYLLAATIRWKQGNLNAAKLNFRKARELDPAQYEGVVAKHEDAKAIRAAVET